MEVDIEDFFALKKTKNAVIGIDGDLPFLYFAANSSDNIFSVLYSNEQARFMEIIIY